MKRRGTIALILFVYYILVAPAFAFWVWTPDSGKWENPKYATKDTPEEQLQYAMDFYEVKNYKMALKLNPTEFKSNFRLGLVYLEKGLFDESIREFKKVLEITPDFGPAYYNLAIIYHRIGDYNSAVEYCDKAKEVGFDEIGPDFLKVLEPYR